MLVIRRGGRRSRPFATAFGTLRGDLIDAAVDRLCDRFRTFADVAGIQPGRLDDSLALGLAAGHLLRRVALGVEYVAHRIGDVADARYRRGRPGGFDGHDVNACHGPERPDTEIRRQ